MKNFDTWNTQKKHIEQHIKRKHYHAGDIWWTKLGLNIGYEQDGKNENFERPVLIIKGFNKEVCIIVPLSTIYKNNKFYVFVGIVDNKKAYAIISQVRLIDTKRLINQIGFIHKDNLSKIKKAIQNIFE